MKKKSYSHHFLNSKIEIKTYFLFCSFPVLRNHAQTLTLDWVVPRHRDGPHHRAWDRRAVICRHRLDLGRCHPVL